ncbi:hypothetical protein [Pedobacter foliorum]|uniref:hypothetical protein n=1 Tax=Pedobacter foliorum TaxID=2739058 RepID=UPI001564B422|nr:hypothetical protein [Pedobacter foliorum]NRF37599.1 hypothetical protein [Pedobacter foliorum]
MAYKILYIEDQATESRESDLANLGFDVCTFDPSSDISEILQQIQTDTNALILDYRLTAGKKYACFDAPTIAQTLRSKHSHDANKKTEIPIILMSNEEIITDYYNDFSSQDLFDFTLTKKAFTDNQPKFAHKLKSFICGYKKIKADNFDIIKILGLQDEDEELIHPNIKVKLYQYNENIFEYSSLIFDDIIRSIGMVIGEDLLSARLGISKKSEDWEKVKESLSTTKYTGILSEVYPRWWMVKINKWWEEVVNSKIPLRRLDADERVEVIKQGLSLSNLEPVEKTKYSESTNFWTICKHSNAPIDPFDGIELFKKDYYPWQEKEFISIDSALNNMDQYKEIISPIDVKAIRELARKVNANG